MPAEDAVYRYGFADPRATALLLNNRATLLGLPDVQGYNPIQFQRAVEFVNALNGHSQEYHEANVHPGGLGSPLLDVLGARYVVVPAVVPAGRPDLLYLSQRWSTVYQDAQVRVLENPDALPRAWVVHAALQVAPGDALAPLAEGRVNPRQVALVEAPPPAVAQPRDPAADRATITTYELDHLRVQTRTTAPGLLVLSEVAYPAWRAYVDGEHTVEFRFESRSLRLGIAISLVALLVLLGLLVTAVGRRHLPSARRRAEVSSGDA